MRSWKTTLCGLVAAFANLLSQGINWKSALQSVAILALGCIAKDFNVTGKDNPPSKDEATK